SALLRDSGVRAVGRGELATGTDLLDRAARLLAPNDPRRIDILLTLGHALVDIGEGTRGTELLEEAVKSAEQVGDHHARAHARLTMLWTKRFVGGHNDWARMATEEVETLLPALQEAGDDSALARAWGVLAVLLE